MDRVAAGTAETSVLVNDKMKRIWDCVDCLSQGHTEASEAKSVSFQHGTQIRLQRNEAVCKMSTYYIIIVFLLFFLELNQTAKTFFPKEYLSRKQNFQRAPCSKWPLPSCRKLFRIFRGKLFFSFFFFSICLTSFF